MGLTKKVGALLGKKQKSEDATFGESLNLGQIAVIQETLSGDASADNTENVDPQTMTNSSSEGSNDSPRSSILDLDFMAAPLAEIEQIQNLSAPAEANVLEAPNSAPTNEHPTAEPYDSSAAAPQAISSAPSPPPANAEVNLTPIIAPPPLPVAAPLTAPYPEVAPHVLASPLPVQTSTPPELNSATEAAGIAISYVLRGSIDNGYVIFNNSGQAIEISDKFKELLPYPGFGALAPVTYDELLSFMADNANLGDKDINALKEREQIRMDEQIAQGQYKRYSWTTTMKSGKLFEFSNTYTPNNHLVTQVKDVSEDIEKSRLLRASLELGTAGYWSYSFTTGKSSLSDYITNKLSPDERARVEANGLLSIIHPDDAQGVQQAFEKAVAEQTRMDCEFRVVLEGDEILFMRMIGEAEISVSSGRPEVFIAFLNDLTKDRTRARELDEIKELSRNKSEFLARMSHEIKTPLNAIVGMTDALRDEVETDEARETASFIADAAENLNTILSQTLEHERLSTTDIMLEEDIVDLGEIIRSVSAMWKKPCADKNITLDLRVSNELPKGLKLDSSRLRQCVTNLLSNAVKFSDSGKIVLAVAPLKADSTEPKIVIAVRDNGIGMSPSAVDNIFKPFKQGDDSIRRRFGGSGLGMSITQHIVKAMNGSIKVQSQEGKGTTIALTLPLKLANAVDTAPARPIASSLPVSNSLELKLPTVKAAEVKPQTQSTTENLPAEAFHPAEAELSQPQTDITPASPAELNSPTPDEPTKVRKNVEIEPTDYSGFDVLVVEDNPINQAVVRKLLKNHINSMSFAFHGEEALEILETESFDVILMDIHMPVKDGIETTLEIRNSGKPWADTVIVALTADPDYQQKRVCRNIGMNDALSKPVKRQELLDIMQKVLDDKILEHSRTSITNVA